MLHEGGYFGRERMDYGRTTNLVSPVLSAHDPGRASAAADDVVLAPRLDEVVKVLAAQLSLYVKVRLVSRAFKLKKMKRDAHAR